MTGVTALAADGLFSLALRADGTVWSWGNNSDGQLGDGTLGSRATPAQVSSLGGQGVGLAAGQRIAMAPLADGTVRAWGSNQSQRIGDGVSTLQAVPARLPLPCRFTGMPSAEHRASTASECHAAP
jgi:alpha-tubulin suppressor-like RCC1 family protein